MVSLKAFPGFASFPLPLHALLLRQKVGVREEVWARATWNLNSALVLFSPFSSEACLEGGVQMPVLAPAVQGVT